MDFSTASHFVPVGAAGAKLHLRRFQPKDPPVGAVLLLHGAIENARIFYTESERGLAPYLAAQGFDAFACDLRGRGRSLPAVARGAAYGQTEAITEDLPALADAVAALTGGRPQHWIAHSWGGVLMASALARFPERLPMVASLTCFGTKRRISVSNPAKLVGIDLLWNRVAPALAWIYGYFPAKSLRIGADSETRSSLAASIAWVRRDSAWVDHVDGFDYGAAVRRITLPRTLHLTGSNDPYLGNAIDVRRFMAECGTPPGALTVIPGFGHIDVVASAAAADSHFLKVAAWLRTGIYPSGT